MTLPDILNVADGDMAVVLAKAEATGDLDMEFTIEQDF